MGNQDLYYYIWFRLFEFVVLCHASNYFESEISKRKEKSIEEPINAN